MKNVYAFWKYLRYGVCGIVAIWGFILIFLNGIDSGGKILLIMAGIGFVSTVLFDIFKKRILDKI